MKKIKLFSVLLFVVSAGNIQTVRAQARPKLVVGIVIDQMRWDYLYRYYDRYGDKGFKRLLKQGYGCENAMINYLPSYTAPGHTCVYTGSVPAIHGISANDWTDNQTGRSWYCVEDTTVYLDGDAKKMPSMSPANLLATTVTDELRLATNFRSRVYGVAIKDRGSILPAGHTANAAYWYNDKTGNFVTSTYYDAVYRNPRWLQDFNKRNLADSLTSFDWKLLCDPASYTQSAADSNRYEEAYKGEQKPVFPHNVASLGKAERLTLIKSLPAGNTLTLDMAKACIAGADGGKLGSGKFTDFLCVSLSSTDYIGHQFAPNSVEVEDCYLRLDREIASFLDYLDATVGSGDYLLFLTADHGGAHNTQFLKDHGIPAGIWPDVAADLNGYLKEQLKTDKALVKEINNYQVILNEAAIADNTGLDRDRVKSSARSWLEHIMPQKFNIPVAYIIDMENLDKAAVPEPLRSMAINGYNRTRSGCLQLVLNPGWFEGKKQTGTTHGTWNPYDTHIPLLWYGWHIPKGATHTVVNMTDIAPTLSALLHIQMPSGCIGKPITDIVK